MSRFYLAGPMAGHPNLNFQAFLSARADLEQKGHSVFDAATHELATGFDPSRGETGDLRDYMARDLVEVCDADAVVVLPGWQESVGAKLEVHVARTLNIPVLDYPSLKPTDFHENVLEEAHRIVMGQRQCDYDHPLENHERIASLWNAYLQNRAKPGSHLTPEDVVRLMILVKIARDMFAPRRDSIVDVAGYARCLERIRSRLGQTGNTP